MRVRLCYYSHRLGYGQKYVALTALYCARRDKNISASHYPFWVSFLILHVYMGVFMCSRNIQFLLTLYSPFYNALSSRNCCYVKCSHLVVKHSCGFFPLPVSPLRTLFGALV